MKKILIAYTPVLHDGYIKFLNAHKEVDAFYILGKTITVDYKYLAKDIRAIEPSLLATIIKRLAIFPKVQILEKKDLAKISAKTQIIMPQDEISRVLADKVFKRNTVLFDRVFLMWDKHSASVDKAVEVDQNISKEDLDKTFLKAAKDEATKSSDWWRHVGAVLVKKGKILYKAHNRHIPTEYAPYLNSDPRSSFSKGVGIELSTALHSEADVVTWAAKKGVSLVGCSLYVSTFPCPVCAKLVAYSGISNLYYSDGYGVLDGEEVLKSEGVKITFVDLNAQKH